LSAISEYGLELAVSPWLSDLIAADLDAELIARKHAWLIDSGLYSSIQGGMVRIDGLLARL